MNLLASTGGRRGRRGRRGGRERGHVVINNLIKIIYILHILIVSKLLGWTMKKKRMVLSLRPSYLPLESKTMVSKTLLLEIIKKKS